MKLVKNSEYVICLANELNFSSAAQKLHIAQSSLTTAIKKIEDDLGFRLFDRSSTPISITLSGKKYIDFLRRFMIDHNEIVQQCIDIDNGKISLIKIGMPHSMTPYLGSKICQTLLQKYPQIKIEFIERSSKELIDLLKNGEVDIAISTLNEEAIDTINIVYHKKEKFNLIVKKDGQFDAICKKEGTNHGLTISQISKMPSISLGDNQVLTNQVSKCFMDNNASFLPKIRTSCIQSALALVKEDFGVLIAPNSYKNYSDLKKQCRFYDIIEKKDELYREIICAIRKNQYITKPIKDVIACISYLN